MAKRVEFYFDVGSPSGYLAWTQLPAIAREAGAAIDYRPILLGGIFKATGNTSPAEVPAKGRYLSMDLARFARRYDVPLVYNSAFPINTIGLMRGAVAAQQSGQLEAYLDVIYPAFWARDVDLSKPEEVVRCLREGDLDAEFLMRRTQEDDVKLELRQQSDAAVARGLFGIPTMFVNDEMFFGQDRLEFVREALAE
ncbi:MAG: 2-hydroxychromene-2-carboxylate isomerase [Rhodospirillales bacterium]|nr:2-hydroxychromene-2-carboxylate isomerase [Rhodospirillales bacterium]MDE0713073.1 2-hydroxychromene-2-carboxylate isomerase [Rhodospirillales bacterium]